jgi:hypothetical protein
VQGDCLQCAPGQFSNPGAQYCLECSVGRRSFVNRTTNQTSCVVCDVGYYQDTVGNSTCKQCEAGTYQNVPAKPFCLPCVPGFYQGVKAQSECKKCDEGQFSNDTQLTSCFRCAIGKEALFKGAAACSSCAAGRYGSNCSACGFGQFRAGDDEDSSICDNCPKGWHQDVQGQGGCLPCVPGTFSSEKGLKTCESCDEGKFAAGLRSIKCRVPRDGFVAGPSKAGEIEVAVGWTPECTGKGDQKVCTGTVRCPAGTFEIDHVCQICLAGTSSSLGSTRCISCSKGKFAPLEETATCMDCPAGFFQPQDNNPSTDCIACPAGYTQDLEGESSCLDPGGIKAGDCGDDEYWVPNKENSNKAGCLLCPPGGSCIGPITEAGINTLFGWSKCPNLNLTYALCAFGAACNGAKNELLENKYVDEFGKDPAKLNRNASCSAFYKNNSLVCAACADGYSRGGGGHKCEKCPPPSENVLLAILGILAGIVGLFALTAMNLSDKGKVDPFDGAKSIGLSFVQVITLLTSFPIAWPQIFVNIFQVGGAVTTMGQHLVNFKCFYPETSEAEVFYTTAVVWAIVPFLLPLASVVVWILLSKIKNVDDLQSKMKSTVVGLLYLIWPALISTAFSLFSCSSVCDEILLRIDLEEECWVGRHAAYSFALGVPMLLLFVLGFPMVAMFMVQRLQSTVQETRKSIAKAVSAAAVPGTSNGGNRGKGKHHRWFSNVHVVENITSAQMSTHEAFGMLYTSFREEVWWWEITVTVRKIVIVGIGVFGESMGEMQVHVTLLCIGELINFKIACSLLCFVCIYLNFCSLFVMYRVTYTVIVLFCTALVQPYGQRRLLNVLELSTLIAIWLTLWAGNVFNANPRCEDDKGGTVAWCDTISIVIGMIDVIMLVAIVATMVYYKKQKQCDACLGSRSHHELEEEEDGMESTDITSFTNPTLDPATANSAPHVNIEMTTTNHNSSSSEIPDDWDAHETEQGDTFYVQRGSGLTQWNKPSLSSSSSTSSSPHHHTRDSTKLPPDWDKYNDDEGQRYYSNGKTQETSWVAPEGSTGGSTNK